MSLPPKTQSHNPGPRGLGLGSWSNRRLARETALRFVVKKAEIRLAEEVRSDLGVALNSELLSTELCKAPI